MSSVSTTHHSNRRGRGTQVALLCAIAACAAPSSLLAQTTLSARPYQGQFGTTTDTTARQKLDLTATVSEAYDDNVSADQNGSVPNPSSAQIGGFFTEFGGTANYAWHKRGLQFAATGASIFRYYNDLGEVASVSHTGGVGFSAELARRTNLSVNQTVAYSPSYLYGLFPSVTTPVPGSSQPAAPDYNVDDSESYSYGTSLSLSHGVTTKGTLTGTAGFQYTDFVQDTLLRRDLKFYNLRGQYAHGMNRNASFRVGYRFSSGNFGYGTPGALSDNTTEHGVDLGVDYTRPLSKTRRLVFGFSLGSSSADVGTLSLGDDQIAGRQYKVIGDSSLGYQFHRTWQARVSYRRGLDYVPDLTQPVYVGGVTGLVEGMLSRKLHFSSGGGYSSGDSALQRSATQFDTSTGYLRFQYIVSKNWAANAEYLYYYYNFTGVAALPLSVPHHLSRNSVRIGVTLWMPFKGR